MVAYPWRNRNRAQALGHGGRRRCWTALAHGDPRLEKLVSRAAADVREAELGAGPDDAAAAGAGRRRDRHERQDHDVADGRAHRPVRGLHVGWSSTDGIYLDGELVEAGDYSGPWGAGRVLAHRRCSWRSPRRPAAASCSRVSALAYNDVSVVTNVSADHLGLHGIDTLDQLAEVKAVVCRITRSDGWVVLNGDDPRVFATRRRSSQAVGVLPRPDSPSVRER